MATVTETTLRKILADAKICPFKVSYYCEKRDPDFDSKMHDVLVIYKQKYALPEAMRSFPEDIRQSR